VEEVPAPGMTEIYPHVYGPIDPAAVVEVRALDPA
jgi:glutathione S-transferase